MQAYARHRKAKGLPGMTAPAVRKAIAEGRIDPPAKDTNWIDFAKADAQWAERTLSHPPIGEAIRQRLPIGEDGIPLFDVLDPTIRYRVKNDFWSAMDREQRVLMRAGKLVDRHKVERALAAHAAARRRDLFNLIPSLQSELSRGDLNPHEIGQVLESRFRGIYADPPAKELMSA